MPIERQPFLIYYFNNDAIAAIVLLLILFVMLALAFIMGLIGNISGIGGGVMIILFLIYGFGFNPLDAAGLSLLTLVFSSLIGVIRNLKQKFINFSLFSTLAIIAVAGALVGTVIASYVPSGTFKGVFAFILIFLGLFSVYASYRKGKTVDGKSGDELAKLPETGITSVIAGLVSGFIGIGIGGIAGTYLNAIKRAEPRMAIATVFAATLPVTTAGMLIHFYITGLVNLIYAPPLVVGAFGGGLLGSWVIRKAPQMSLKLFQGYIIISFGFLSLLLFILSEYHL